MEKLQERDIDIEDSVRVEEQWDKVEKAMTEVATTVCGITKGKYRQNSFRVAKQKKKERKDITGTNCFKGDNGELLVSEEQVSGRWREYFEKLLNEEN